MKITSMADFNQKQRKKNSLNIEAKSFIPRATDKKPDFEQIKKKEESHPKFRKNSVPSKSPHLRDLSPVRGKRHNEYQPIEFFLQTISDTDLVTWIMDQTEALRAVFKVIVFTEQEFQENVDIGQNECHVKRFKGEKFEVKVNDSINIIRYKDKAICTFVDDGTAIIFIQQGNNLVGYHFCFEECPEGAFEKIVDENKKFKPRK